jgi:1-hydroxycarotenoid 3,4-desaturase
MTKVAIIGAGIGGLVAAMLLSAAGCAVTVCEAGATPGGKLREVVVGEARIDSGPTVFTLRPVFDAIFAQAGLQFSDHVALEKLDCLARHGWEDGSRLDLFSDARRNAEAIGDFAGAAAAKGYVAFVRRAAKIFELLDPNFMQVAQPGLPGLIRRAGPGLSRISPFASLWPALGKYFTDPRLRQLFGRYATYSGASPLTAPATLMLIAHAELLGVYRLKNGMFALAKALEDRARAFGARFLYGAPVSEILTQNGKASGIRVGHDDIAADAVIANADVAALDAGLFGGAAKLAVADAMRDAAPSLSAMTWSIRGRTTGFPLSHHNVFFSQDYPAEFAAIAAGRLPPDPTVYFCAQGEDKYFCLVNAPAGAKPSAEEAQTCLNAMLRKLRNCRMELTILEMSMTGPREFGERFPATGGALYGRALRSWRDPFARLGARTKLPGLFLAGGSVHPGPGLPMAAMSGRRAAACILQDM